MNDPIEILKQRIINADLLSNTLIVKRNEFICRSGQVNTKLYFVKSGSIRVFICDDEHEHNIRFGYKNSFISALDSFIHEKPSEFYIQALKKTELVVIEKNEYLEFIHSRTDNIKLWNRLLEMLIYQQIEREVDLLISSPTERYRRVLERSPLLFQEIPNKYIANYLRMTPETLSRIKKNLI